MAQPQILTNLNIPISAYAFNGDRTQVALCPNSTEVQIYSIEGGNFTLLHTLTKHTQLVTGIDWAPTTNRIVTCSHDRNGYVWSYQAASRTWSPSQVLLRINRGATCVKWSPNETKFAVASGAKLVSVCYFDKENDWWVSKHLKKPIRSTVLCVDWHPNNVLIACGGTDNRARVYSAFIKGLDEKPAASAWGERLPFGTICADVTTESGGWIHDVAFTPSGNALGWVAHDSSFNVYSPDTTSTITVTYPLLPSLSLMFISETLAVAAGHDCSPIVFSKSNHAWKYSGKLDEGRKASTGATNSALAKFRAMDSKATTTQDSDISTIHQNSIRMIRPHATSKFTTCGMDGKIVVWDTLNESFKRIQV